MTSTVAGQQAKAVATDNQPLESGLDEADMSESATADVAVSANALWYGLVFKLADVNLVIPCFGGTAGLEVVACGELSPLPLAKSWVRGMMDIRGEIYTVVDFADFLSQEKTDVTKACHLILLPDHHLKSALLLAGRVRFQSFAMNLPIASIETLDSKLTSYLSSVLIDEDKRWGVIDVHALSNSQPFLCISRV